MAAGTLSKRQLLTLNATALDTLFGQSPAGPIPDGDAAGTAIMLPGSTLNAAIAEIARLFAWKGKTFDAARGTLRNRITPFGVHAISARVYEASSLFDGRPCIVLDYSKTSVVARFIRDEIRELAPGLYLGKVYFGKTPTFRFALRF